MKIFSMQNYDTKQIAIWGVVILAIVGLFVGLAYLGSGKPPITTLATPVNEQTDRIKGPNNAKVTLVEYSDFECPACAQYEPLVREVINAYPNDLRFVYRHFPLIQIHPSALPAAKAAEAAGKQGKFWEMHDLLFDRQSAWVKVASSEEMFTTYAEELGLNKEQFATDMKSDEVQNKIGEDLNSGNASGVSGTPTFYLNGNKVSPGSLDEFKALIDAELQK